jgi:hypothetical protein
VIVDFAQTGDQFLGFKDVSKIVDHASRLKAGFHI